MEKDSVLNYATPIHKSLIQDDVDLGIGVVPVVLIVILTIILMRLVSIWCMFAGFILFIVAKFSTRKDPHFLESLLIFLRFFISPSKIARFGMTRMEKFKTLKNKKKKRETLKKRFLVFLIY